MVSHLFYYQLALVAIIWLFVMLHLTESKPGLPAPPVPAKPKRKRSPEPKAFEGLTQKPHCVLCEPETGRPIHRLLSGPIPCRARTAAPGRWIRLCTFVPTPSVTIAAGWG